jgi:hypothetical protein
MTEGVVSNDPIARMGEQIRRIVCTTSDEATARRKIETVIRDTASAMKRPTIIIDQSFTDEVLKLPLKERAQRLRQYGRPAPKLEIATLPDNEIIQHMIGETV